MDSILTFDELDSTNAEARRRAAAGERGPVWLMARRQTAGVGRRGRAWDGGQGNLTATLLLTLADKPPVEMAQLAFVAGLAVWTAITAYVPAGVVKLKWPNDILIAGRKVCGMLIESGPAAAGATWAAVGIGLNLATYPEAVERPATAVADHLSAGMPSVPSPDQALAVLAETFDVTLGLWLSQGFEPIREAWLARAEGLGGPCTARLERETVSGVAECLDADGALLLRLPGGMLRRITAGDVFFGEPS
jgi:BirA family transcriptional regulator, biotin operon repressor / biotin---[acetyl-CoA-carboxylase] ligase